MSGGVKWYLCYLPLSVLSIHGADRQNNNNNQAPDSVLLHNGWHHSGNSMWTGLWWLCTTMEGYFQRYIGKLCWEAIKGHLKWNLIGSQPPVLWVRSGFYRQMRSIRSARRFVHLPDNGWYCYLTLSIHTSWPLAMFDCTLLTTYTLQAGMWNIFILFLPNYTTEISSK